jgi:hypothetical protein
MKGVSEMTDVPAESANPHDGMRGVINAFYRGGADAPLFVEFLLGMTPGEQDEFLAGNDAVWLAKKTPERLQRYDAIMAQLHKAWRQHRAERLRNMSTLDYETWSQPFQIIIDLGIPPTERGVTNPDPDA